MDNNGKEGANVIVMPGIDVFFLIRYRFESGKCKLIAEVGPDFVYFTNPETYYINANPSDPLNGKDIYKKWDIAVKPGFMLQTGKHFQVGIEFPIGIRNIRKQYPEYNKDSRGYFRSLQFLVGWRF